MQIPVPASERPYAYYLCSVPWIGGASPRKLLQAFGSYREIFRASESALREAASPRAAAELLELRKAFDPPREYEALLRSGQRLLLPGDAGFPQKLLAIPDPPPGLFVLGNLPAPDVPAVAVIGARECSPYGEQIARELGHALGGAGIPLISGMARGIDGISQRAALEAGGYSCAVLGSGADICYPPSNRPLYDRLLRQGGILSTYPPGTPATAKYFPPRNRIVSGLADFLVVIEARQRSGTLITVDMALEQGREIYAVPGRLTDRLSDGCNGLLGQGAQVYLSPELLIRELREYQGAHRGSPSLPPSGFHPDERQKRRMQYEGKEAGNPYPASTDLHLLYAHLDLAPRTPEELAEAIARDCAEPLPVDAVLLLLMQLVLDGHALQLSQNSFCRK
ncbi:MAG: DNA-processing protein DprA [Lachnospiraceae bacterium]|nr:DNA-processing protein DprA [Lachnospiraceae bacterium]